MNNGNMNSNDYEATNGRVCPICRQALGDKGPFVDLSGIAGGVLGRVPLLVHSACSDALEASLRASGSNNETVPANGLTSDDIREVAHQTVQDYMRGLL